MHATRILLIALLAALAAAPSAAAQSNPPPSTQGGAKPGTAQPSTQAADQPATDDTEATQPLPNLIDIGIRGSTVSGDEGRFERYRDMGNGLVLDNVRLGREVNGYLLDFSAEHVGRRDQRYVATAVKPGRFRGSFMWDQIPMLLSEDTRTLFSGVGSETLSIEDAIQAQGQANPSSITDLFQGRNFEFLTQTRRHIGHGTVTYEVNDAWTVRTNLRHTDRSGTIPFGGSFGHSALVEMPAPTEHTLSDFDAHAEYVSNPWLVRAGYTGSWFRNDITSVVFDNPFRAIDTPSTPSQGRLSLAPSHSFIGVNGLASVRLPGRSRATAYVSIGMLEDDGASILPQTINGSIITAPLDRTSLDGEARTGHLNLSFVSRPRQFLDVNVRFRTQDYSNEMPEFELRERVAYDNTPSALNPPIHAEQFSLLRHTFDADVRFIPRGFLSAGAGFTSVAEERDHRIFESTTDNQFRLTLDAMTRRYFSLRAKYEHAQRRGEGIEAGEAELAAIGEQPQLRHFDIASRDRDRFTLLGTVTPLDYLNATFSFAAGKDDFIESVFGLRDNTHRVWSAGADVVANERVSFGMSYSFEQYEALQRSRQANPGPQFLDPSRNWAADTTDKTHSLILDANVTRIADRVDLRLSYDFNRGRAIYDYITGAVPDRTLPEEVVVPTTLPTPTALPPTLSELNRGTVDLTYALSRRLSLGLSYWYERFDVQDWTLDIDANPNLVRGQALFIGYLYRPYTANTAWARLFYRW